MAQSKPTYLKVDLVPSTFSAFAMISTYSPLMRAYGSLIWRDEKRCELIQNSKARVDSRKGQASKEIAWSPTDALLMIPTYPGFMSVSSSQ